MTIGLDPFRALRRHRQQWIHSAAHLTYPGADCNDTRGQSPHLHVYHRPGNPNRAEAKTKHPLRVEGETVTGGLVKRAGPAMVHAYFEYMTSGYPRGTGHGMLLVQLHGPAAGQPWAPVGAHRMLARARLPASLYLGGPRARSCIGCNIPCPA